MCKAINLTKLSRNWSLCLALNLGRAFEEPTLICGDKWYCNSHAEPCKKNDSTVRNAEFYIC